MTTRRPTISVNANQYSIAAHWRLQTDGLQVAARGSYAYLDFDGKRFFRSETGDDAIDRHDRGQLERLAVLGARPIASQELWAGSFFVRPSAGIEYYRLSEDSYEEEGGGSALDLSVDKRTSDELAVNALLIARLRNWRRCDPDEGYFRFEAEAGRRQIVGGVARRDQRAFRGWRNLHARPRKTGRAAGSAAYAALVAMSGFRLAGEVGAEEREDKVGLSARATVSLGF